MRINEKKHSQVTDPNEYYDSPGFPPRPGDQSAGTGDQGAQPDPYNVIEDLIWNVGDEELDFPEPIPYSLDGPAPDLVAVAFPSSANDTRPVPDITPGPPAHVAQDSDPAEQRKVAPATSATEYSDKIPRKVDVPVDQKPPGLCEGEPGPLPRSEANGDGNLPSPTAQPLLSSATSAPPEPPFLVAMRKGKVDEHLNSVDFCGFLEYLGYRRWLGNGATELILPQGCVLQRVDMLRAKEHVESIISGYDFLQAVKDNVFRRLK